MDILCALGCSCDAQNMHLASCAMIIIMFHFRAISVFRLTFTTTCIAEKRENSLLRPSVYTKMWGVVKSWLHWTYLGNNCEACARSTREHAYDEMYCFQCQNHFPLPRNKGLRKHLSSTNKCHVLRRHPGIHHSPKKNGRDGLCISKTFSIKLFLSAITQERHDQSRSSSAASAPPQHLRPTFLSSKAKREAYNTAQSSECLDLLQDL